MEDLRRERKAWYKIASDLFKWGQHALFLTWSFRVFQWDGTSHSRTSILEHSPFPVFAIQLYPSSSLAACLSHHLLFSHRFQAFQTICFIYLSFRHLIIEDLITIEVKNRTLNRAFWDKDSETRKLKPTTGVDRWLVHVFIEIVAAFQTGMISFEPRKANKEA